MSGLGRRVVTWGLGGIAALVVVIGLVATLGASLGAAAVIVSLMDRLDIRHDGIWTLRLNVFEGRASIGPVEIGDRERPAKLEQLLVDIDVPDLLKFRINAEIIELDGFRLDATRDHTGDIGLAGNPIRKILGTDQPAPDETPEDSRNGRWDFGIETIVITDAHMLLTDVNGGEIEARIERLAVERLRSWEATSPAEFSIDASINDIGLRYEGESTPLAETVEIRASGGLSGITYDKIARFAGETLEETIEGEISTEGRHDLVLHPDGRVEGRSDMALRLDGLVVDTPAGDRVAVAEALLELGVDHDVAADGRPELLGDVAFTLAAAELSTADGETVALASLELGGEGMRIKDVSGDDQPSFGDGFFSRLGGDTGQERTPSLARLLIQVFVALAQEAISRDLEISGAPRAALAGIETALAGEQGADVFRARLESGGAEVGALDLSVVDGAWRVSGDIATVLSGYESVAVALGREISSSVASLSFDVPGISAESEDGELEAKLEYAIEIEGIENSTPQGELLKVASISLASPEASVTGDEGYQGELSGQVDLAIVGVETAAPEAGGLSVNGGSARFAMEHLSVSRQEDLRGIAAGAISLADWTVAREEGALSATLASLDVFLPPSRVVVAEGRIAVAPEGAGEEQTDAASDDAASDEPASDDPASDDASAEEPEPSETDAAESEEDLPALGDVIPGEPPAEQDAADVVAAPADAPAPSLRPEPELGDVDPTFQPPEPVIPPQAAALPSTRPEPPEPQATTETLVLDAPADLPAGAVGIRLAGLALTTATPGGEVALEGGAAQLAMTSFDVQQVDGLQVATDGEVALAEWRARLGGAGLDASVGQATVRANGLAISAVEGATSIGGAFDLSAAGLAARVESMLGRTWRVRLAALRAGMGQAGLEGGSVRAAGGVQVSGLEVVDAGGEAEALRAESVELAGLGVDSGGVKADAVRISGLDATFTSDLIDSLSGDGAESGDAGSGASEGGGLPIAIGEASIGAGSRVVFADVVGDRVVRMAVDVERLNVGPLSPSPGAPPTRFDLALRLNEVGSVNAGGGIALPTAPNDLNANVSLGSVGLPTFSPYLEALLRLRILSGSLSADARADVSGGALNGQLDLVLDDFALEPLDAAAEAAFQEQFVVSSKYALDVLRDGNGRIRLSLPVSGAVDDPDIDFSQVIGSAIGGVFASLLPTQWFKDDLLSAERFVLDFRPGSSELPPAVQSVLDNGAADLAAEPDVPVLICGLATLRDVEAARDAPASAEDVTASETAAALDLAAEREAAVRRYLSERHGIPSERLGQCETAFEPTRAFPGLIAEVLRGGG